MGRSANIFFLFYSCRIVIGTWATSSAVELATPEIEDPLTWLVKSVCQINIDGGDRFELLSTDPYDGCPTGSSLRKIEAGDYLPYNNLDLFDTQMADSFALLDSNGDPLYVHTFDYEPFNEFNQHSGSDGYDVYVIKNGIVSITNTKDGGGYGSTFYGEDCDYGNGWALFPSSNFLTASQDFFPIAGVY